MSIADRLILAQWLSPAFPVGGYAYSHGLEWAIAAGDIDGAETLAAWVEAIITHGAGRSDALLLCQALAGSAELARLDALAQALASCAERLRETRDQGRAFAAAVDAALGAGGAPVTATGVPAVGAEAERAEAPCGGVGAAVAAPRRAADAAAAGGPRADAKALRPARRDRMPTSPPVLPPLVLPLAVGRAARALSLPAAEVVALYLHAMASNLVQAGVRFIPLGQGAGQRVLAGLHPAILTVAQTAAAVAPGIEPLRAALGSAVLRADMAAMRHETMETRIFLT